MSSADATAPSTGSASATTEPSVPPSAASSSIMLAPISSSEPSFPSVMTAFQDWMGDLETEQVVKELIRSRVRELESAGRELAAILQKVHHATGYANLPAVVQQAEEFFEGRVRGLFSQLSEAVPEGEYFRYHYMYNITIQRFVYQAALTHYLKLEDLLLVAHAANMLGIEPAKVGGGESKQQTSGASKECDTKDCQSPPRIDVFHLDLEDYLAGITLLSNELSRFVVNAVTHGDYQRPKRIATFLNNLDAGFRLLNLKNDMLRKKFDSLKYDLKKVEEVVYDLSIRGLLKQD